MTSLFSIGTLYVVGFLVIQIDPVYPCDTVAVFRCVGNNFGVNGLPDIKGIPPTDQFQSFCRAFQRFKVCAETPVAECSGSSDMLLIQQISSSIGSFGYLCEDKYEAILSTASCWNNDQVQNGMDRCATFNVTNLEDLTSQCSELQKVNQCTENYVREHCGEREASLIKDLLQHTLPAIFSCDINSVKAFRPELTSLLLALVVTVLAMYGNSLGQSLF